MFLHISLALLAVRFSWPFGQKSWESKQYFAIGESNLQDLIDFFRRRRKGEQSTRFTRFVHNTKFISKEFTITS